MSYLQPYPRQPRSLVLLPLVLAGAAFVLTAWMVWDRLRAAPQGPVEPRAVAPRGELADFEQTAIQVFRQVSPAVVHITSPDLRVQNYYGDIWRIPGGVGTGFVWDEQGHVVTNYHVVENAARAADKRVVVRFANQREFDAVVVGTEEDHDIAVLRLITPPPRLYPIPLIGSSADLQTGQAVFAIGNPFGYDQSLSHGIISALDRPIRAPNEKLISGCIQVDAPINPGNSGGPLLDSAGRLIGMNTAITSPTRASAGIGFAIAVDTINQVVAGLIDPSQAKPALGVVLMELQDEDAVMVREVVRNSGAAEAGIRGLYDVPRGAWGDVLISIDGRKIASMRDVVDAVAQRKRGERARVVLIRGLPTEEQRLELEVELR